MAETIDRYAGAPEARSTTARRVCARHGRCSSTPQATVDAYRGRVHPDVIEIWEQYGYGTFGNGFFRVIDPDAYELGVGDVIGKVTGNGIAIPILASASPTSSPGIRGMAW